MHVHEYLAKEILSRRGLIIPEGRVVDSAAAAAEAHVLVGTPETCVKAQIRAGDRAKAGGVLFAATAEEAAAAAARLLGRKLATSQTRSSGLDVRWVYVEAKIATVEELYVAVTIDPVGGDLVALAGASQDGTADPRIERAPLTLTATGVEGDFIGLAQRAGARRLGADQLAAVIATLARTAVEIDATLVEVHPLGITRDGRALVLDAKIAIDDNALARHPELARLRQMEMEEDGEGEVLAADRNRVNYMRFDGDIGVVVNGAGLALATHDMIVDAGGRPANFMDIRTTASSVDIAHGIGLVLANPATRVLLVNVHGGGMQRCDTIVEGLAIALKSSSRRLPLVVRLEGQNAEFARSRLANFQSGYIDCPDMGSAVAAAVAQARV